jgi:hypothetical protein
MIDTPESCSLSLRLRRFPGLALMRRGQLEQGWCQRVEMSKRRAPRIVSGAALRAFLSGRLRALESRETLRPSIYAQPRGHVACGARPIRRISL